MGYTLTFYQTGSGRPVANIDFQAPNDAAAVQYAEAQTIAVVKELRQGKRVVQVFGALPGKFVDYPLPEDEAQRLAGLPQYGLFGSAPERQYDQIAALAADLLHAPICLISIIGQDDQWLKARCGLNVESTPRSVSFCAHTILKNELLVVLDAEQDVRFRDNPLVTGAPHIRFYAGATLAGEDGTRLGSLCIIDTVPRERFDDHDRGILRELAAIVSERFRLRRIDRLVLEAEREARRTAELEHLQLVARTEELSEMRHEVHRIVAQIDTIAVGLKALAINAKIEAVRAGQSGSGFGVVAIEVKKMAVETRTATNRAQELLRV